MRPIEVGCRVVCIDARFPEIAYIDCVAVPRAEGVYTVSAISSSAVDILTRRPGSAVQLLEFPWPRLVKPGIPWWLLARFRRLDDLATWKPEMVLCVEPIHA